VEKQFPSLAFVFKMAEIIGLDDNTVKITVPYNFHRDKIMEKACQKNLEELLTEIVGDKARIEAVTQANSESTQASDELQALASTLGGEVIS
jgi:chromosomal replication initiation ATPase DnaA